MSAMNGLTQNPNTLQARLVSGSVVLLSGSGLTTVINLAYNVEVARFLGPTGFGHATVVYTLLTLISAVTLSFQVISAKVVAQQSSVEGKAAAFSGFHRSAWGCGILVALALLVFQRSIAAYLNLPDPSLVAILAVGAAFYVPLGSRRGYIQGIYGFRRLAVNLVVEGGFRLGGSLLLIMLGQGVRGVIIANAVAIAIAYLTISPMPVARVANPIRSSYAMRELSNAMIFFAGQALINNCDILLVKHFFSATEAGLYAAVAMVGRVIFAFSSSVVNSMFPLVAGSSDEDRRGLRVIATALLLVLGTGSALALGLRILPSYVWTAFFGSEFEIAGKYNLPYLLTLYAITTIVYSLSVVIITFEMSYKIAKTSWLQLAFSGVLVAAICRYHSSLREVIFVQLILLTVLFVMVGISLLVNSRTSPKRVLQNRGFGAPARLIRRVSEDEVIAEFLKSEVNAPEFRQHQATLRKMLTNPNLDDAGDNAIRRALLFIRHRSLWKEIPSGTNWCEVEINDADLGQIRAFPRAQWRKLARGRYEIDNIADRLRTHQHKVDAPFLNKIAAIRDQFLKDDPGFGAVILIGLNDSEPLTILDGNHRVVAALLSSPARLKSVRFLCGLSPRMMECCWYNTNFATLFRYGKNVLTHAIRNPETELARLLQDTG
jgi:O-antigen/teichoic acid export membrane protein